MKEQIVLDAHDVTRVWNLALAMAANDEDGDGDIAAVFAQALDTYVSFKRHLEEGGLEIDDGQRTWVSSFNGTNLVLSASSKETPPPKAPSSSGGKKRV